MEGLVRLVAESLGRHGITVPPPRIDWSPWTAIDPNLCLTAPCYPGVFVVAEQMVPHTVSANAAPRLVVLKIGRTEDIGIEMARLCYHSPLYDRINTGRCVVRFAVVDDDSQRASTFANLLANSFETSFETQTDSRFRDDLAAQPIASNQEISVEPALAISARHATQTQPAPIHLAPLPSGF